jgi:hypothetical protein
MDIEGLTKSQIILLTLLVSFVTSIATGIVTVTLLEQAPTEVTQTINRVVERTVERVVPDLSKVQGAAVTTKEITVVVKEDDLITDSIEKNQGTLTRIIGVPDADPLAAPTLRGLGIIVDPSGIAALPRSILAPGVNYAAVNPSGDTVTIKLLNPEGGSIALIQLSKKGDAPTNFTAANIPGNLTLKLGQSVIALSGDTRSKVSIGIISSLDEVSVSGGSTASSSIAFINTNVSESDTMPGSPLLNIFGETIGIRTGKPTGGGSSFIPSAAITEELTKLPLITVKPTTTN